jgi:hypothetical protein
MDVSVFFPPGVMAVEVACKYDVCVFGHVIIRELKGEEVAHRVK